MPYTLCYFTDAEIGKVFTTVINWFRTYHLVIGEHRFTFFDMWIFAALAFVVFWFINGISWIKGGVKFE